MQAPRCSWMSPEKLKRARVFALTPKYFFCAGDIPPCGLNFTARINASVNRYIRALPGTLVMVRNWVMRFGVGALPSPLVVIHSVRLVTGLVLLTYVASHLSN